MPKSHSSVLAFNRGLLSTLGLARVDLTRYKMAANVMTNWMARVLGSMSIRPGWQYIANTLGNRFAKVITFVFSTTDQARMEVVGSGLTVFINDVLINRASVTAAVTNGTFLTDLSGWTDSDEIGATTSWLTGGGASFVGDGSNNAILDQDVTCHQPGIEHALRIVVLRGPLILRIGNAQGDDTYQNETILGTGTHSIAFTPVGNFWIRFMNPHHNASQLGSCVIEAAGLMVLPSPWIDADIPNLRWTQSADVTYVTCTGSKEYQPRKIERRAKTSWSIVLYEPTTGPFRTVNITPTTLTASALSGEISLSSSEPFFNAGHVGSLFQLTSVGQTVSDDISAADVFTNPVRVNGVAGQRDLTIHIVGAFVGTVTLQSSVAEPGNWVDVTDYTVPTSTVYNDTFDNQVIYYRIGIKPANYTSGTATCSLAFPSGSLTGNVRVRAFITNKLVAASVLTIDAGPLAGVDALGATGATTVWSEGAWSDFRGWPQTTVFHEGRLWFFGSTMYGSVSNDYENFDPTVIGDSGPIQESIGEGPIDNINWALSMQRLAIGLASSNWSARSSSLDAPLTTVDFVIRPFSTIGSANVQALRLDKAALYVQLSGVRLMEADMDIYTYDYKAQDLTLFVPDLNAAGIVQLMIQRIPDTRIFCRRADGTVSVMVIDAGENVTCWLELETDGFIEDMSMLPGAPEDQIYFTVRRTVQGADVRFHEKVTLESNCTGLPKACLSDAFTLYHGAAVTTIGGLGYLEGRTVCVWGWNTSAPFIDGNGNTIGKDLGTFVVSGGQITGLSVSVTDACVGLPYTAQWQSMKQAFAAALGTPLNQAKRIDQLGLVLQNTHAGGIHFGPDFDHLDDIPLADLPRTLANDAVPDEDAILTEYDQQMTGFNDIWSTDSRVCLQAASPRPATCLAFTASMDVSG